MARRSRRRYTERRIQDMLINAINDTCNHDAMSFADDGMLTQNKGLTWRTPDGREFQVTIVESTPGRG